MRLRRNRWLLQTLFVLGVALLAIQLVPSRVSNPSARNEPPWDSPRTRTLAVAACFDCHSNETKAQKQQLIDGIHKTFAAAGFKGG